MTAHEQTAATVHADRAVGEAVIVQGTVRALAADGMERLLLPGSPVYAGDRVITGPDGMVSLIFADHEQTQLDLGRLSELLLDRDVYGDALSTNPDDGDSDVIAMQEALQDGDFDPTMVSEPPAAGSAGAGGGGGNHPYVVFEAVAAEVTPDSGAETDSGVGLDFPAPPPVDLPPGEAPAAPDAAAVAPSVPLSDTGNGGEEAGVSSVPLATPDTGEVVEAGPGLDAAAVTEAGHTVTGNLMANDTSNDSPAQVTFVEVGGIRFAVPTDGSITLTTELGAELTVHGDGTYSYTIGSNVLHEANGRGDGRPDYEIFNYTITDANGDSASSSLTINVLDTVPEANPDSNTTVEGGAPVTGNVIFGWDDFSYVPDGVDSQSADPGLTLFAVSGDLADAFALDTPLATIHGGTITFSAGGSYVYLPPAQVDNPMAPDGSNQPVQEHFTYTVEDGDGSPARAELTIDVLDTAPRAFDDRAVVEEGDRDGDGLDNRVSGNVILADHNTTWDGVAEVRDQADQQSADSGLHLVDVRGDFAAGVNFTPGTGLATAQGGTIVFADDGSYTYTAPGHIQHEGNGQGDQVPDNEQFTCTIEDGDGSRASAVLTIAIRAGDPSLDPGGAALGDDHGTGSAATATGGVHAVTGEGLGAEQGLGSEGSGTVARDSGTGGNHATPSQGARAGWTADQDDTSAGGTGGAGSQGHAILAGDESDDVPGSRFGNELPADGGHAGIRTGDRISDAADTAGDLFADTGGETMGQAADLGDSTVEDLLPPPDPTV